MSALSVYEAKRPWIKTEPPLTKVEGISGLERLHIVFVRLLAHAFTYFRFHTIDGVFGDITKLMCSCR